MELETQTRIERLIRAINHAKGRHGFGAKVAAVRDIADFCGITVPGVNYWLYYGGAMSAPSSRLIEMMEAEYKIR